MRTSIYGVPFIYFKCLVLPFSVDRKLQSGISLLAAISQSENKRPKQKCSVYSRSSLAGKQLNLISFVKGMLFSFEEKLLSSLR